MKILYAHNDYTSASGEEASAEALAMLLTDHGHSVFWFRRSSNEIAGSLRGSIKGLCTGLWNPFAARQLSARLDEIRPDLAQVQNLYPLLSPSIFGPLKDRGIPVVMRCPNYRLFCPNGLHLARGNVCERCLGAGREFWCLLRRCEGSLFKSLGYALRNVCARISGSIVRHVDMFMVQTEFQRRKFMDAGIPPSRIGIVPALMPREGYVESSPPGDLISFVGRVSPEKGIEDFLEAARLMPDRPFAVAGSDDHMPGIREKLPANVHWLGFLASRDLRTLYLQSRIIVVPSRWYESFPNVVVQAMVYGRPVVAADLGALPYIVQDRETGLLFRAADPLDLAEKLSILYPNDELCHRLGAAGRKRALDQYSPQRVYSALMAVYAQAMWQGGPPRQVAEQLGAGRSLSAEGGAAADGRRKILPAS
jgi:glycosyltransferase involved in cell wall biosynthesis